MSGEEISWRLVNAMWKNILAFKGDQGSIAN